MAVLLTIDQAAARLGKTARQVRYLIQSQRLPARKVGGRWVVESGDLPLSAGQRQAVARKERQLRAAVEEGLGLLDGNERAPRYSIRDLKAFQVALPIYRQANDHLGAEHPVTEALHQVLEYLSLGCHRFEHRQKAEAYRQARDAASLAVCELILCGAAEADAMIQALEQDLMATFAGLLRRVERGHSR
jgi:excisionase family DNA binding protein